MSNCAVSECSRIKATLTLEGPLIHMSNGRPLNAQEKRVFGMRLTKFSEGKELNTLTTTHAISFNTILTILYLKKIRV